MERGSRRKNEKWRRKGISKNPNPKIEARNQYLEIQGLPEYPVTVEGLNSQITHHPLFRSLQTLHMDDYHNPTFTGSTGGCPREPWHDLHCKIDGLAAYDILTNFEECWLRAVKLTRKKRLYDDALLKIERVSNIIHVSDTPSVGDDNPEAWHTQIFRSIDSTSVEGFPKEPKDALEKNLICGKNVLIDMSIHTAYVKVIRAVQHYIYIENQYFIGSSYNWSEYKDLGANNLIPMEIAFKIAEKIKANERFAVYIIIPMWPEGDPTGAATQRILFWQHKTMEMMYKTIYNTLVEVGLEAVFSPQDYLNFFCLGNREAVDMHENIIGSGIPPPPNTPQVILVAQLEVAEHIGYFSSFYPKPLNVMMHLNLACHRIPIYRVAASFVC
ncbi:phospholipase D beta 1-like [Lathyrus oleraceus]|uniref:phospholipase D beta 1-like n=1 Tax=Pisum sativum TaxID=3888 RepID=UPI0021D01A66|nr:phospholipase D beta 1-like [Pisum sativum]